MRLPRKKISVLGRYVCKSSTLSTTIGQIYTTILVPSERFYVKRIQRIFYSFVLGTLQIF